MENIQQTVKDFCVAHQLNASIENRMLDLTSELGELAKEVLKMTDYGTKPLQYQPKFNDELGDVFFSLITVANYFEIDMQDALEKTLQKYKARALRCGIGSEHD